jgi:ABC-type glycerol-3-phosphate transport system substrate-binding protein
VKKSRRLATILAAALAPILVVTACSSGNGSSSATTSAADTTAATSPAADSSPAGDTGSGSATSAPAESPTATESSADGASSPTAESSAAGGGGAAPNCKVQAAGPLQFATDKAAWQPDFESMNAKSTADCGLSINFTGYSDAAQYDAFIKQGFQTNAKPTLFTWHTGDQLKELVDQGLIAETTDLWKAAEANGDVPKGLIDNYTYNGKQYCVPLNVAYWAMYYNKKIFAENNLQVPKTWADFTKIADTLVAKGIVPLHQMNIIFEFVWFQALLVGSNPEAYQGLETGKTKYTDPTVVDAVKAWYQMANKKYFIDPGVQTDPQTLLKTGKVAMAYFGTFFTGQLTSVGMKSDQDYGIFALPNYSPDVTKQQMVLETGPLCVGKGSQDEQAALAYSAWWMGKDAQQAWSDKRGDVSFNPKVAVKDPALAGLLKDQADWQIQKRWLEATPNPIYTVASPAFGEFVTNPVADPTPMLTKIQDAADKYWASHK